MSTAIRDLVSVIIPTYNRVALLEEAVNSALAQTWFAVEIIVVDDGSSDETPVYLDRMTKAFAGRIQGIRQRNAGPGPAREAGRCIARGEFIQYLDSDDLLHPQKCERQVQALRKAPGADIAYGITRLINVQGQVIEECLKWSGQKREFLFPGLLVDRWWSTNTPLWRKTICDRIGGWSSLRYSEDWEYEARAGALQARLIHVPEWVCDVRHHGRPRETQRGKWLLPPDQVRFFRILYESAVQAGVAPSSPEMRHFVRWVFFASRLVGQGGNAVSAAELLSLARQADSGGSFCMSAYAMATRLLGVRITARIVEKVLKITRRKPGQHTLLQSWMKEENRYQRKGG